MRQGKGDGQQVPRPDQRLLKAGVEIDGVVHPTDKGVPQGGVVSPLLANIVLNKLDWFLHSKGFHGNARKRRAATACPMSGSPATPTIGRWAMCPRDEGRSLATGLRRQVANHRKRLW